MNKAEEKVSKFYNSVGWEMTEQGFTEDASRFEELRECAKEYVSKCRLKLLDHIPPKGEYILDMASGPIQYPEYLQYSKGYSKRYCVDLSELALKNAEKKIGNHGVYLCGSFFDLEFNENYFDCSLSLHTIYHMDKDKQEEAVRKLIKITKPGKPVIIIYSNPKPFIGRIAKFKAKFRKQKHVKLSADDESNPLYFYAYPMDWWKRFNDVGDVKFFSWRSLTVQHSEKFIPDNNFGKFLLKVLFSLEGIFPKFFARHFDYPMIVIDKRQPK